MLLNLFQYVCESQISLHGYDPKESMILLEPRKVGLTWVNIIIINIYWLFQVAT